MKSFKGLVQESMLEKAKPNDGPEYKAFFNKMLKKYGVKEPDQLDPEKKKKFFDEIDSGWDAGENETD